MVQLLERLRVGLIENVISRNVKELYKVRKKSTLASRYICIYNVGYRVY